MSGDVQPRKRKDKDKKKKKSQLDLEDLDGDGTSDRFLNVEDEDAGDLPPGGDFSHDVADDHGHHGSASWCGKVIFLTLLAALLVGAGLVFFESWGKSFNEVSIADSRFADIFKGMLEERDEHEDDHIAEHISHDDEDDEEIEAMLNGGEWHEVGSPLTTKLMARFELTARQFPLTEYEGVSRRRTEVFERIYSKGGLSREDGRRLKNEIDELRKLLVSSRRKKRASKVVGDDSVQSSSTRVVAGQTADPLASVSATQFEPMPEQILLTKTEDIQPSKEEHASSSFTVVPQAPVVESSVIKDTPVSSNQHGVTLDPTSASHASTGPLKTSTLEDVTSSTLGRDVPSYLLETSAEEASEDESDSDSRTSDQPGASTAVPKPVQEESFTSSFWPLSGGTHETEPQVVEEPPPDSEEEEEEIEADTDDPSEAAVTEAPSVEVREEAKPAEVDEGYASDQEESESEAAVEVKPAVPVEETTPEPAVPVEEATPEERVETPQPVSEPPPAIQVTEAPVERLVEAEVLPDLPSQPPVHEEVSEPEKPEEIEAETPKPEELPRVQEEPAAPVGTSEEESTPSTSTSSPSRDAPPSQYSSSYSQQPSGNPWENEVSDDEAAAPPIDDEVGQDEVIAESAEEQQQANPWDNYEFKDITNEEDFEIRDELDELDRLYAETKTGSEVRKVMFKYEELMKKKPNSPRALHGVGLCLDRLAFYEKSNALLDQSLATMQKIVALGPYVPDELLRRVLRTLYDKMKFRGHVYKGIPILLQAVEKFPAELEWRHYLIVAYLTVGRNDDAKLILKDTMSRWPDDGYSKVHYGFLLKLVDKNYKTGAKFMQDGIDSKQPGTQDGRFFYHLGDAYMRLGEMDKMKATYEAGEKKKLFLSAQQRSLHNVEHLTGRPWWTVQQTTYGNELKKLSSEWRTIRKEGLTVLGLKKNGFKDESESLLDTGDWKEFTLWARGKKQEEHCKRTPQTCKLLEDFQAAVTCKQGQIKFSVMKPGTHIWAHTGPTNARIRGHLGLAGVDGAKIRVGDQIGEWKEGDFIVFDDSFDHEVWHEGNKTRLVLIVDMWHPELTEQEKVSLSPI